jgi:cellulose synthase/poly-beta-1,6-N-acetylglucosamine synthase-like glycosyltransferase
MKFSVIMPVERVSGDAERAIGAVLAQSWSDFELILVGNSPASLPDDRRIVFVSEDDRNPARRRNIAAGRATGEILAFIDDDAFASRDWLARGGARFDGDPALLALGGPDPAPDGSPLSELISDTLLAAPLIGSGIACHEGRKSEFFLKAPHDIALVNLMVRREAFDAEGGFDETIGYIGEDTELIRRLIARGRVLYAPEVIVHHRRRAFPEAYVRQRFRYRVKTGRMLVAGSSSYRANRKILAFLIAGFTFLATVIFAPPIAAPLLAFYVVMTLVLGIKGTKLPAWLWPFMPLFFAVHHGTYFLGIVAGMAGGILTGRR